MFPPSLVSRAEQKPTVARAAELLRWCDTLEAQLHQTRTLVTKADSLVLRLCGRSIALSLVAATAMAGDWKPHEVRQINRTAG